MPDIPGGSDKYIQVLDAGGEQAYLMPVQVKSGKFDTGSQLSVGGLAATTAGVTDTTDKRFLSDIQLAAVADLLANKAAFDGLIAVATVLQSVGALTSAPTLLASTVADLNTDTPPALYTAPIGITGAVITRIVARSPSTSLTTVSLSIGWTTAAFADVVANATHTGLTGATKAEVLALIAGLTIGAASGTLKLKNNTKQGVAATATFDVFGYVF